MTTNSNLSNRLAAAASAFFISLVLFTGTVTAPSQAQSRTIVYGEVA